MKHLREIARFTKPLVPIYAAAIAARNWCYDRSIFKSGKVDLPVISVGNITAGGNGKTPLTEYLVRYFLCRKKSVAVLSRGYKRSTAGTQIVSDGKILSGSARTAGDEPYQVAKKFPEAVVVVDKDRLRGASIIHDSFHPDVIILDDAFQHRRLERDLDLVLIDGNELLKGPHFLPAGRLREPLKSLRRADGIVLTNCSNSFHDVSEIIRGYTESPCFHAELRAAHVVRLKTGEKFEPQNAPAKECVAFCAIAKPENFLSTLTAAGFTVKMFQAFNDHHNPTTGEYKHLEEIFRTSGASVIVTTEKDAVRLEPGRFPAVFPMDACYYIEIEIAIIEGKDDFHSMLDRALRIAA
jgi:tetraacyldisaccharide 4'-kinase